MGPLGRFVVRGERLSARQMAERSGLPFTTIRSRIYDGKMTPEEAMTTQPLHPRRFDFRGERLTLREIAQKTGVPWTTLRGRIYGPEALSIEEAASLVRVRKPPKPRKPRPVKDPALVLEIETVAKRSGISVNLVRERLRRGWTLAEIELRPLYSKKPPSSDFVGKTFGALTVVGLHFKRGDGWRADCLCSCGTRTAIRITALMCRRSCGCQKWRVGPHPERRKKYALQDGRFLTAYELAEISGLGVETVKSRLSSGKTPEEAMQPLRPSASSLVDQTFGRLRILRHVGSKVEWVCACGATGMSDRYNVTSGGSRSCGCSKKGQSRVLANHAGEVNAHGVRILHLAPERVINHRGFWVALCPRCKKEFSANYEKLKDAESCGCMNPRRRKQFDVFGAKLSLNELSKLSRISRDILKARMDKGATPEMAAFGPAPVPGSHQPRRFFEVKGERLSAEEVAKKAGVSVGTFWTRLRNVGLTPEEIVARGPVRPHRVYKRRKDFGLKRGPREGSENAKHGTRIAARRPSSSRRTGHAKP